MKITILIDTASFILLCNVELLNLVSAVELNRGAVNCEKIWHLEVRITVLVDAGSFVLLCNLDKVRFKAKSVVNDLIVRDTLLQSEVEFSTSVK